MGWAGDSNEENDDSEFFGERIGLDAFYPRNRSPEMFRVVPYFPVTHIRGGPDAAPTPDSYNELWARAPRIDATWGTAYDHLTWKHCPSPYISFFIKFDMALRWKNNFIREGAYKVRIFCYDTKYVRWLLDANEMAKTLTLKTLERVGKRHYHQYLVLERISGKDCLGVYEFTR